MNNIKKKEENVKMKLLLITPYGMTKRSELINDIHRWGEEYQVVRVKRVILNKELIEKHFFDLDEKQRSKIIKEWASTTIEAYMLKEVPIGKKEELERKFLAYISINYDRGERDSRLWFPEYYA